MNHFRDYDHLNEFHEVPFFDANDHKILAFDMFRGPSTGFYSEFDLSNPGRRLETENNIID